MSAGPEAVDVAEVIKNVLIDDFENIRIVDVRVLRRVEDEDGVTLEIQVIFEGTPKDLDARKVAGAVRHVRPKLTAMGEAGFPLFSFVSSGEAGSLVPA